MYWNNTPTDGGQELLEVQGNSAGSTARVENNADTGAKTSFFNMFTPRVPVIKNWSKGSKGFAKVQNATTEPYPSLENLDNDRNPLTDPYTDPYNTVADPYTIIDGSSSNYNWSAREPSDEERNGMLEGRHKSEHNKAGKALPQALKDIFMDQPYLSSLLIFVPIGFASHFLQWSDAAVFTTTFMGILPLAWLIGKTTEDLASHTNQVLGGLINATFGNIVEMLLCVSGIMHGHLVVVQCTLIGSMLSNLLLVLGTSFWYGGMYYKIQRFNAQGAKVQACLMLLALLALVLPTLYASLATHGDADHSGADVLLLMSRLGSILLLCVYVQYLYFQLISHCHLFQDENDDDEEEADLGFWSAMFVLALCTILTAILSDYLIASIEPAVISFGTSKEFVGIIILPIIGNAAEHYTAIVMAGRNKMDLSLGVAVGSGCQMMLLVTPWTVLVGWVLGEPMSLNFHPFQAAVLMATLLIVNAVLANGETNWLEGLMLLNAYIFIAMLYFCQGGSSISGDNTVYVGGPNGTSGLEAAIGPVGMH